MAGRRVRQFREGRAKLAALPACDCPAGYREEPDGTIHIVCHSMTCAWLTALSRLKGRCHQCGRRYQMRGTAGNSSYRCRLGHEFGAEASHV